MGKGHKELTKEMSVNTSYSYLHIIKKKIASYKYKKLFSSIKLEKKNFMGNTQY